MMRPLRAAVIAAASALLAPAIDVSAEAPPSSATAEGAPHAVPAWYLGMPVLLRASPAPPGVDRKTLPQFLVYVHAPVSPTAGAAAMRTVPRPEGLLALPPHQDTLSCANSAGSPRLGVGYFVLRGLQGSEATVRTQAQPDKSWPRSPLVSEIRVGPEWVKVNNHAVVEYGVRTGLLELQFFNVGGLMWAEALDPAAQAALGRVPCEAHPALIVPPIDWLNDREHQPGEIPK